MRLLFSQHPRFCLADAADDRSRLIVRNGDVGLFCESEGGGETAVLLHGLTSNRNGWRKTGMHGALKDCRVIAADARGHGESDKPREPDDYGLKLVEDALEILKAFGHCDAHWIGYSMGAMTALRLAIDHPDRVRSLTLAGYGWMDPAMRATRSRKAARDLREGRGLASFFELDMQAGESSGFRLRDEAMDALLERNDANALAACLESLEELEFPIERLSSLRRPVLIANGRSDPCNNQTDPLMDRLPDARRKTLRGNHLNAMFDPDFTQYVAEFIRETDERHG